MLTEESPEERREIIFKTDKHLKSANDEMLMVIDKVRSMKAKIEVQLGGIILAERYEQCLPYIALEHNRISLCFVNWSQSLFNWHVPTDIFKVLIFKEIGESIYTEDGKLKRPRPKRDYKMVSQEHIYLRFKQNGWVDDETGKSFIKSDELIETWVNKYLTYMQKKKRK